MNGRISWEERETPSGKSQGAESQFGYSTAATGSLAADMIRGNVEANALNQTYFSHENIEIVQQQLRHEVYRRSGNKHIIDKQSTDELVTVMRAMYLQYGRNEPTNIAGQVVELNQMVAEWCVPKIIAEIEMYNTYRRDASTLPTPMSHPVNISQTGTKSAPFRGFF